MCLINFLISSVKYTPYNFLDVVISISDPVCTPIASPLRFTIGPPEVPGSAKASYITRVPSNG